MEWGAVSEEELWDLINDASARLSPPLIRFWEAICIEPEKWQLPPWGDEGGGFWVVGLIGRTVLWYNDIEEGFNLSPYAAYGLIGDYRCNQDNLEFAVQTLLHAIETGERYGFFGPPVPVSI